MRVVYSSEHLKHDPKHYLRRGLPVDSLEIPLRAQYLLDACIAANHDVVSPDEFGRAPLLAIHTAEYLDFLETAYDNWRLEPSGSVEIMPHVHPGRHGLRRPTGFVGRVGYHLNDTSCPIVDGSWAAIAASANTSLHAGSLVLGGDKVAYALCRPPGHHAFADAAGGFCYLNNAAICAQSLLAFVRKVAIIDLDVHHGNGTQALFYDRSDVFFASLHGDPNHIFPWFSGHGDEVGAGPGLGFNCNAPLAYGSGDKEALTALDRLLEAISIYDPDIIVVSLGFDAYINDPFAFLRVTDQGFAEMARRIARLDRPSVLIQEGGYASTDLGMLLGKFMDGFERAQAGL